MSDAVLLAIIGSGAFSAVVSGIVQVVSNHAKKDNAEDKVIKYLLARELKMKAMELLDKGYITEHDLYDFSKGFELYTELGGNGTVKKLADEVLKLPVQDT